LGVLSSFVVTSVGQKARRYQLSSHLLLLSSYPFEWRKVPQTALMSTAFKACIMTNPIWSLSFPCSAVDDIQEVSVGSNMLFYGEFSYIPFYWEWAEYALPCFEQRLKNYSLYPAMYGFLYPYSVRLYPACLLWELFPYHQHSSYLSKDMPISLWDLHRLGWILISKNIYEETFPSAQVFSH